ACGQAREEVAGFEPVVRAGEKEDGDDGETEWQPAREERGGTTQRESRQREETRRRHGGGRSWQRNSDAHGGSPKTLPRSTANQQRSATLRGSAIPRSGLHVTASA